MGGVGCGSLSPDLRDPKDIPGTAEYYAERAKECGHRLECGGACYLAPEHAGPHLCPGDLGVPGTCPA